MKQRKTDSASAEIKKEAEVLLSSIAWTQDIINKATDEYNATVEQVTNNYQSAVKKLQVDLGRDETALISLMRKNKVVLFAGADIVELPPGILIHSVANKITIPKTALASCEEQGFTDVIKIAKSLDRAAIEKWPDAKLVLIGAERKPKEEFNYDLRLRKN